ncbi:MAG: ferredoxin family protein [Armatimonadetes bacterium]|nr:ferredoxin family protein [Armatimonadota bacterium]
MAYVITEACLGVKDKSCVAVCPVDCIHENVVTDESGKEYDMLFINPDECIDCGLCEPECPVTAIFADSDVPKQYEHYIKLGASVFK